jgi:hypothetical protein
VVEGCETVGGRERQDDDMSWDKRGKRTTREKDTKQ